MRYCQLRPFLWAPRRGWMQRQPRFLRTSSAARSSRTRNSKKLTWFANKPVIVTDAIRQWKALSRWTPEFFKTEFGDLRFTIAKEAKPRVGYNEQKDGVAYTMAQFIDRVLESTDENPAPYFRNRVLYQMFPSLKQDIEPLPEYFLPNWLPDRYMVKYVSDVLNRGAAIELYIGGKGAEHYDGAGTHAFLMQVYGRKQFIVYSPEQEPYLYASPEKQNFSMVNSLDTPDLGRFPLFEGRSHNLHIGARRAVVRSQSLVAHHQNADAEHHALDQHRESFELARVGQLRLDEAQPVGVDRESAVPYRGGNLAFVA